LGDTISVEMLHIGVGEYLKKVGQNPSNFYGVFG
jgi:hypothetical protein